MLFRSIMMNKNKTQNTEHRYSTVSFKIAVKVAEYFDKFHLQNQKQYLRYRYWKKILVMVQKKEHLSQEGMKKTQNLKKQINKLILG